MTSMIDYLSDMPLNFKERKSYLYHNGGNLGGFFRVDIEYKQNVILHNSLKKDFLESNCNF